ncbi:MAG: 16S rRNA (guanine(527)-N(7))-methyltransferase RsmG [Gammaproteobacteria bacterium]|nr:16S rRNA (guanine(527)-N(7))-methyltransferase RsmG [Gammaproteobacteria bacterium]
MLPQLRDLLPTILLKNGIQASEKQREQWIAHLELITKWHRIVNLTAILDSREMIDLHLIDSLTLLPFLHGTRLIDIGSGAGLPGIPLAIMEPAKKWVLLEKNSKKSRFLVQVIAELGLTNVEVQCARVQDFHPALGFDTILARAFTDLNNFLTWTSHLLGPDGRFIAMKARITQEELTNISDEFVLMQSSAVSISGRDVERHILSFTKKR